MKRLAAFLPFLITLAIGCGSDTKDSSASASETSKHTTPVTDDHSKVPLSTSDTTPNSKEPVTSSSPTDPSVKPATTEPPAAKFEEIPASLKHAGYEYEGLSNPKPMDMEAVISGQDGVITGSQTTTLKEVKDGKATFTVERTGRLSALGTDEESVEKDGVYITSSSLASVSAHAMDLPADPKPGMTWKFHLSADRPDAMIDVETTCKVIGIEAVRTKGGTYKDALLVEQTGVGTMQHKKVRTVSKDWYVKGLGTVKADQQIHFADGTTKSLTIQEAKHS